MGEWDKAVRFFSPVPLPVSELIMQPEFRGTAWEACSIACFAHRNKGNTELTPLSRWAKQALLTAAHTENLKTQTALSETERR